MRRDDVIAKLKEAEPALWNFGVTALYLFGSHARDEAKSDSIKVTMYFGSLTRIPCVSIYKYI